jgi:DNA-binding XRE family transcriptional regulator
MVDQPNLELRRLCKRYGIPLWRVAQRAGVSEQTLIRWLREELKEDRYYLLMDIIGSERKELIL